MFFVLRIAHSKHILYPVRNMECSVVHYLTVIYLYQNGGEKNKNLMGIFLGK